MQKFLGILHKMKIAMELQVSLFGEQRWGESRRIILCW